MAMRQLMALSAVAAGILLSLSTAQASPLLSDSAPMTIKASELAAKEKVLTDFPLMESVKASIRTLDNATVEKIAVGRSANPENVKRVEKILSEKDWDFLFPMRAPAYTYLNFLKAIGKFPAVCGSYKDGRDSEAICRKTLATMFAHFAQETGGHEGWRDIPEWRQALVYLREVGWVEGQKGGYNGECNPNLWQGQTWPCGKDKDGDFLSYFGRGAKQLSYNYNYGPFSEAMYGDVRPLLDKPEIVADSWMNLASAVFFFVYPQPPKPSMLHVIDGSWQPNDHDKANGLVPGFGVTIQIINGGVECGGANENAQSVNRINYYREFAKYLKVPVPADEVLGCKNMKQFDEGGAGALPIYWEEDWSWNSADADGKSYACQLVSYQTPYSAFKEGDYAKCVQHYFKVNVINDGSESKPVPTPAPAPGVNVAPVARIAGPVGAVEAGSAVSLSATGSSDANGDKLTYTWMSQDGQTISGDKSVITFNAPEKNQDAQYVVSLKVSDGTFSSTASYILNVKAKIAADASIVYPAWSATSQWKEGDIVNNNGVLYQCRPLPAGAWCNIAPAYYEPGVGISWADAWKAL